MHRHPAATVPVRRCVPLRWLLLLLCTLAGCKSNPKYDGIEAELRTKDRENEHLRAELEQQRLLNQAYQGHLARNTDVTARPGPVAALPLKEIVLGPGTGGANSGTAPGDDSLQVVIVPRDDDGAAIKVPGRVVVLAYEVLPNGVKVPIGRWDVEPDRLKKHWRPGLLTTGYFLNLGWDRPPGQDRLRVAVRLTTLDGRVYEADKDVPVKPLVKPPTPMMPSPFAEELPPPRPMATLGTPVPQ
jgi:hypothetical protein